MWVKGMALYMITMPVIFAAMALGWFGTYQRYIEAMSYYDAARARLEAEIRTREGTIDPNFTCRLIPQNPKAFIVHNITK